MCMQALAALSGLLLTPDNHCNVICVSNFEAIFLFKYCLGNSNDILNKNSIMRSFIAVFYSKTYDHSAIAHIL